MNLDDYNIHVIASVFKQWLRDLPNPLMTFELYQEFLRAMGKELSSHLDEAGLWEILKPKLREKNKVCFCLESYALH